MNYDESPIIANLRKAYWSPDEDGQQIWQDFRAKFALKNPEQRRQDLTTVDTYLAEQTHVTHEHAALIQHKRELQDIHTTLWRAGR